MYLCMARIAHREGYPEIGLYWEKAAYEEAEHAAKFAELLGEDLEPNMKADTKSNLAWRVDCEYGATAGKFDLAACAKKNGLDAIHDTVHEMARDEARHGQGLRGPAEALLRLIWPAQTNTNLPRPRNFRGRGLFSSSQFPHRSHFSMRARSWSANLPKSLLAPPRLRAMTCIRRWPTSSSRR